MMSRLPFCAVSLIVTLSGCAGADLPSDSVSGHTSEPVLTATVRMMGAGTTDFVADEVVASVGSTARGRELVIYARSYDLNETMAFVIDLSQATFPGVVDLSQHGVLYVEPGLGIGGGDLTFDGQPSGILELDSNPTAGASIAGRFSVLLPGYDPARATEELSTQLEGTFLLQVMVHQS